MHPAPRDHAAELFPLGIRTVIRSGRADLVRAAASSYAAWAEPPAGAEADAAPVTIHLSAGPAGSHGEAVDVRVDGHRLVMEGAGVSGRADARLREAACTVPPDLARDPARLAVEVLDTLVLFLLTRAGRVPLHASAFVAGGTAVVLAGPSGSGKSTLALAAQRRGLHVLSDDTVYVQLAPVPRVWGFPRPIHVFPEQVPSPDEASLRLRSGKLKAAVPLAAPASARPCAERAVLALLERGAAVGVQAVPQEEALRRMTELLEPGFDHFREQLPSAVRVAAAGGAFRLTLSAHPDRAIDALLDRVGATG